MPRNTREWAHRKLKEGQGNLNWTLFHLNEVEEKYRPQHPEIADQIIQIMELVSITDTAITELGKSF